MSNQPIRNTETPPKWRAYLHLAMGVIYILFGILVFYVKRFGSIDLSDPTVYGMASLLALYGVFRIWRGWKDLQIIKESER